MRSDPVPDTTGATEARITRTLVEDKGPMTAAQFDDGMQLLLARVAAMCDARERQLEDAVRRGVAGALSESLENQDKVKRFWRTGFDELSAHASDGASQWVGKRILTAMIAAVATVSLVWLVRNGGIK